MKIELTIKEFALKAREEIRRKYSHLVPEPRKAKDLNGTIDGILKDLEKSEKK